MEQFIYAALKQLLANKVPILKEIDWYLGQYDQSDEGDQVLHTTPACFLEFSDDSNTPLSQGHQLKIMNVTAHIVDESAYDSDLRMTTNPIQSSLKHLILVETINGALNDTGHRLSDITAFASYLNTPNDRIIVNNMVRITTDRTMLHELSPLLVTKVTYQMAVIDYSGTANYLGDLQQLLVSLELDVQKAPSIVPPFHN